MTASWKRSPELTGLPNIHPGAFEKPDETGFSCTYFLVKQSSNWANAPSNAAFLLLCAFNFWTALLLLLN